jgi:hypothetical protein
MVSFLPFLLLRFYGYLFIFYSTSIFLVTSSSEYHVVIGSISVVNLFFFFPEIFLVTPPIFMVTRVDVDDV